MNQEQRMKVLNLPGLKIKLHSRSQEFRARQAWCLEYSGTRTFFYDLNLYQTEWHFYSPNVATFFGGTKRSVIEIAYKYLIKPFEAQNDRIFLSKDQFLLLVRQ